MSVKLTRLLPKFEKLSEQTTASKETLPLFSPTTPTEKCYRLQNGRIYIIHANTPATGSFKRVHKAASATGIFPEEQASPISPGFFVRQSPSQPNQTSSIESNYVALATISTDTDEKRIIAKHELEFYSILANVRGVIKLIDSDVTQESAVLVFPWHEQPFSVIYDLDPPIQKEIIRSLFSTIQELHALGVAHCDLKPQNIRLEKTGDHYFPILIDLGNAVRFDRLTKVVIQEDEEIFKAGATPDYSRPGDERLGDPTHVDIFALGVILYNISSGKDSFINDVKTKLVPNKKINELESDDEDNRDGEDGPTGLNVKQYYLAFAKDKHIREAIEDRFSQDPTLKDLLETMLTLDLVKEKTISNFLKHPFFDQTVCPT